MPAGSALRRITSGQPRNFDPYHGWTPRLSQNVRTEMNVVGMPPTPVCFYMNKDHVGVSAKLEESAMRDQMVGFMQSAIIFLLLTNAASALVALCAMRAANLQTRPVHAKSAVERKIEALLGR